MNFSKFISDILTNPDNLSFSSKRAGGWISLLTTITFGFFRNYEAMTIMAGLVVTFFGLTSVDGKLGTKNP